MAFYISHDTFMTGESRVVRERGKAKRAIIKDDPQPKMPDMKTLSNTAEQTVMNNMIKEKLTPNINKISVNESDTKNKQECEPKKTVTLTSVNKYLKEDNLELGRDYKDIDSEDYSISEGMKTDCYVQIETVENITLPLPRRARKNIS